MANVTVYNMEGNEVGTMELNDAVFGVEVNEHLVHLAVVRQLANKRQGTQKAKTRTEVSGGGRKPSTTTFMPGRSSPSIKFSNPWSFGVERTYTNGRFNASATIQKAFTVDFLTKKQKKNEGEVPQYYVENSHR